MKDERLEEIIKISNQLKITKESLCKCQGLSCITCPLLNLDDCSDYNKIACLEYNEETGKYE